MGIGCINFIRWYFNQFCYSVVDLAEYLKSEKYEQNFNECGCEAKEESNITEIKNYDFLKKKIILGKTINMNSLKTKTAVFPLVTIVCIILGFCYSSKVHSQSVDVFSMKLEATDLLDFRNQNLVVLFTFRKEFITLSNKYIAVGKSFPNTSTKKIDLQKDTHETIHTDHFRSLILFKQTIDNFIAALISAPDSINLNTPGVASNYEIILKPVDTTEGGNHYVGLNLRARKKGDPSTSLSTASVRINPCPPCN